MLTTHFVTLLQGGAPPVSEDQVPVTLSEAKAHVRVDGTAEDDLIAGLIAAAKDKIERDTGVVLRAENITLTFDGWYENGKARLPLYRWPVNSIGSVAYDAADGTEGALDVGDYRLREFAGLPHLVQGYDVRWPDLEQVEGAVRVTFNAGYASNDDIPATIKHAALLLIGHWFEHREAVSAGRQPAEVPLAYDSLIRNFRKRWTA